MKIRNTLELSMPWKPTFTDTPDSIHNDDGDDDDDDDDLKLITHGSSSSTGRSKVKGQRSSGCLLFIM